jgi:hemoglobin
MPVDFSINQYEFGQRPAVSLPSPEFLKLLKEAGIRKLVSDHYDLLSKSEVNHLFPKIEEQLDKAKQRSSDFFIQICGGHPYFNENRGKPMLARRHQPFAITPSARMVWLNCYQQVLSQLDIPDEIIQSFWNYLNIFSFWMVNTNSE